MATTAAQRESARRWRKNNPEKWRAIQRRWRDANRERWLGICQRANEKKRRRKNPPPPPAPDPSPAIESRDSLLQHVPISNRCRDYYVVDTDQLPPDWPDYYSTSGEAVWKCDYWLKQLEAQGRTADILIVQRLRAELIAARGQYPLLQSERDGQLTVRPIQTKGME